MTLDPLALSAFLPILILCSGASLLLIVGLFREADSPFPRLWWGAGITVTTWLTTLPQLSMSGRAISGMVYVDGFSFVLHSIILGGLLATFLLKDEIFAGQRVQPSIDVDVLFLLAAAGGMVMVAASNLIVLFIGFELLSISVYALTGLARKEKASAEGALKYFVLGAFSSAFMLYGMVLIYAATGSLELAEIGARASISNPMVMVAIGLLIFGFGFKVSLVPFHFWTPDAYQGAPTTVTTFMAVVTKTSAFGAFFRVMYLGFASLDSIWVPPIWLLAVLTMTIGNIVALRQTSIKRMLAYSSIAHAGYLMMAFLVMKGAETSVSGGEALLFYLVAYSLMTVAAFGVVAVVTTNSPAQYDADDVRSLSGIGWTHPLLGLVMTIALLSLAGVPPLAGFMGKFYLFSAAIHGGFTGLAIIAALNSVISLFYYLRVIVVMYFSEKREFSWSPSVDVPLGPRVALMASVVGLIYLGIFSSGLLQLAREAVERLA